MSEKQNTRNHTNDLRGVSRLVVDAATRVVDIVEATQRAIGGWPLSLFSRPIFGSIRGITRFVGAGLDLALGSVRPLHGGSVASAKAEAAVAVLNGVVGDYLRDTKNPLAIEMAVRPSGAPRARLVVLVHGSSMSARQWQRRGHDHGAALAQDLAGTAVYIDYNSGLHVSENGRDLAIQLEALVAAWPVPVESVTLVGFSMGGLVARSACHYADGVHLAWREKLRALVCIGTPHHGTPLERLGNRFHSLVGATRFSAPLARVARLRSAGVTDLRFGNVIDAHWHGHDRFEKHADDRCSAPLPGDVACFALAGTIANAPGERRLPGDGLVPVDSALGRHRDPNHELFTDSRRAIAYGVGHFDLLGRSVYPTLREWLLGATGSVIPETT